MSFALPLPSFVSGIYATYICIKRLFHFQHENGSNRRSSGSGSGGTFKNPVYDSLYDGGGGGGATLEERAGLLDSVDPLGASEQASTHRLS